MTQPVIHLVDDDASFRKAIGRVLETAGYEVALYESAKEYLEHLPPNEPGCILLDLNMSPMDGLELQERLSGIGRYSPIIFLTGHGDIPVTVQAIKGGADNFLTKPVSKDTLTAAIETALARFAEARARQHRLGNLQDLVSQLTPREREVFELVVRGKLNKQIAHALGKSERTVKIDRHSVMEKLKVHSLAEAVSIAERLGMLSFDEDTPASC